MITDNTNYLKITKDDYWKITQNILQIKRGSEEVASVWYNRTSWIQDETGIAAPSCTQNHYAHKSTRRIFRVERLLYLGYSMTGCEEQSQRSFQCKIRFWTVLTVVAFQMPSFGTRPALPNIKVDSGSKSAARLLQSLFLLHLKTLSNHIRNMPLKNHAWEWRNLKQWGSSRIYTLYAGIRLKELIKTRRTCRGQPNY
jgi:hypothetical protein